MPVCNICNKELADRRGLKHHLLRTHKLSKLESERILVYTLFGKDKVKDVVHRYVNEEFALYETPIDIKEYIKLLGLKRTSKEERATNRYRTKYKNAILQKYGVDNISKHSDIKNKKIETAIKNFGTYENYIQFTLKNLKVGLEKYIYSDKFWDTNEKIKKTCLEKYGNENFGQGNKAREKASLTRRKRYDSMSLEGKETTNRKS